MAAHSLVLHHRGVDEAAPEAWPHRKYAVTNQPLAAGDRAASRSTVRLEDCNDGSRRKAALDDAALA